ncbi:hypothetical protein [Legionella maioricensis]|uniref:Uncharacterized protein n=1 Tax=Legionella maioricensis TaxID=2896528 RepID=A0A9X2IC71_9GAMM|nr:hypothetical protein [Legionella maioricensis]MCL9685145.1 hypothetical protein [Legionella maioricensis]MCL9688342.1 hypothetical protein [Legionella maioricensis]
MPKVTVDLNKALTVCPATIGMMPSSLSSQIEKYMSANTSDNVTIKLNNGETLKFLVHKENNKTVLSSVDNLASNCKDGVATEMLPEILTKLAEQQVHFTALQFPHAFMVKGRLSGMTYRAHFNHIVIYKDSSDNLNAGVIDSTINPIGVRNPIPVLGWLASNSIISGEELLQVKLTRLLGQPEAKTALQAMCDLPMANVISPILTYKQPSVGDKRCGIYTLNAMAELVNHILESDVVTTESITKTVTAAHQALNEPEMMKISYPVETGSEIKQVL